MIENNQDFQEMRDKVIITPAKFFGFQPDIFNFFLSIFSTLSPAGSLRYKLR